VSAWFASERYVFLRHQGAKWLLDVLLDSHERFLALPGMEMTRKVFRGMKRRLRTVKKAITKTAGLLTSSDSEKSDDLEANILPVTNGHSRDPSALTVGQSDHGSPPPPSTAHDAASVDTAISPTGSEPGTPLPTSKMIGPTKGKLLWKNALQTVKMRSVASTPFSARAPHRQRTTSSTLTSFGERKRTVLTEEPTIMKSRLSTLKPKLNGLVATEGLEAHTALVRHLQFSPDGKFLATSR
jgi:hypothetical protein